jgi:hypothetical protein
MSASFLFGASVTKSGHIDMKLQPLSRYIWHTTEWAFRRRNTLNAIEAKNMTAEYRIRGLVVNTKMFQANIASGVGP